MGLQHCNRHYSHHYIADNKYCLENITTLWQPLQQLTKTKGQILRYCAASNIFARQSQVLNLVYH